MDKKSNINAASKTTLIHIVMLQVVEFLDHGVICNSFLTGRQMLSMLWSQSCS